MYLTIAIAGYSRRLRAWLLISAYCLTVMIPVNSFGATHSLSLGEAITKTLNSNPQLHQFTLGKKVISAERGQNNLKPGYELSAELENVAGTGELSGVENGEITVALSSVIELSDKRQARLAISDAKLYTHELQRQVLTLEILGRLTRNYITVLRIQEELKLAADEEAFAQSLYEVVRSKAERGAASDVEVIRAKTIVSQNRILQHSLNSQLDREKVSLAGFWGDTEIEFSQLTGSLFSFNEARSFASLFEKVKASPAMKVLASDIRLKEMEVNLAQLQDQVDFSWQFGIKRLQESQDSALVFGFSVPLRSKTRNQNRVAESLAERERIAEGRRETIVNLNAQLFSAYSQRSQYVEVVYQLQKHIIPNLNQVLDLTKEAYDKGLLKYQDWIAAQQELLEAKQQLIDAASLALINQSLIEQLTSESLSN